MPPPWFTTLAWLFIGLSLLSALVILADILGGHRQKMAIMNIVWPITALYFGPFGLWAYLAIARRPAGQRSFPQQVFNGASHCGAGCAIGDFIGDWLVFLGGIVLFGSELLTKFLFAFVLAYVFGIAFQYFAIAPMRGLGLKEGIVAAIQADTLSLVAYQIGMFAWMAVGSLWLFPDLTPIEIAYWFMMQIAMMLGFVTTYPMNWWLIRSGIKEAM